MLNGRPSPKFGAPQTLFKLKSAWPHAQQVMTAKVFVPSLSLLHSKSDPGGQHPPYPAALMQRRVNTDGQTGAGLPG